MALSAGAMAAFHVMVQCTTFAQLHADHLALGVGQLQRHQVLARDGLDHADADQRERARQVLGQVDKVL